MGLSFYVGYALGFVTFAALVLGFLAGSYMIVSRAVRGKL